MATLRLHRDEERQFEDAAPVYRFPTSAHRPVSSDLTGDVLDAIHDVSRRIDHLARELNCLGHFDDENDDRPRAA